MNIDDEKRDAAPKTWGDMTDAEKLDIALFKLNGGVIQFFSIFNDVWTDKTGEGGFNDPFAYRKKSAEPVREVVTMGVAPLSDGQWKSFESVNSNLATHRITFETVDGEMDCASIKAEKL